MGSDKVKLVELRVSAVEGNISTISTSKFYSQDQLDNGVWVTLPTRREVEVCISGQLKEIGHLTPQLDIICGVMAELKEYFNLTR